MFKFGMATSTLQALWQAVASDLKYGPYDQLRIAGFDKPH